MSLQICSTIDDLSNRGVEVLCVEEFRDLLDWVPDHDFIPLIPNCGKVLGVSPFGEPTPYYSEESVAYSMPYVHPFCDVEHWASIPTSKKYDLAKKCLGISSQLQTHLNILNGREIILSELTRASQPVTIPVKIGERIQPRIGNISAISFLNEIRHSVAFDIYV